MDTIKLAVQKLGTQRAVAQYLGIGEGNMSKYVQRGYLPECHWDKVNELDLGVSFEQYITEGAISRARRHSAEIQDGGNTDRITLPRRRI